MATVGPHPLQQYQVDKPYWSCIPVVDITESVLDTLQAWKLAVFEDIYQLKDHYIPAIVAVVATPIRLIPTYMRQPVRYERKETPQHRIETD